MTNASTPNAQPSPLHTFAEMASQACVHSSEKSRLAPILKLLPEHTDPDTDRQVNEVLHNRILNRWLPLCLEANSLPEDGQKLRDEGKAAIPAVAERIRRQLAGQVPTQPNARHNILSATLACLDIATEEQHPQTAQVAADTIGLLDMTRLNGARATRSLAKASEFATTIHQCLEHLPEEAPDPDQTFQFVFLVHDAKPVLSALGVNLEKSAHPNIKIEAELTERQALEVAQAIMPARHPLEDLIRQSLHSNEPAVNVDELMEEKLPAFAAEYSKTTSLQHQVRELAHIPVKVVATLLEIGYESHWERHGKTWEVTQEAVEKHGLRARQFLAPAHATL